ncbi:MAG: polysulfide reductase NrfD [Ardenticatenaceae bacterium]|nr:polysulfide reductase NrfD [Ardenticatenaceae bacterium]
MTAPYEETMEAEARDAASEAERQPGVARPERRWESRRNGGRSVRDESETSYYGLPVIHTPHWKWEIYTYFFLGGIAAASYVIASLVQLLGGAGDRRIVRAGRYISLATLIPSPILLVLDLGRPDRFHHMLRVVKLRSPMSLGTWGLILFSAFSGLSALIQAAHDGLFARAPGLARLLQALPGRVIGLLGMGPAFFVSGYTGVLLVATAVPLWAKNYLLLGPLFIASSISTATSAIALVLALGRSTSHRTLARLERLEILALLVELGLILTAGANAGPIISRPIREGRLGWIFRAGVLGTGIVAPLGLLAKSVPPGTKPSRFLTALTSTLVLVGGFLLRYVMVTAGRASAADPQATFELTKANGRRPS